MKIKKSELKQLIKEELEATMDEGFLDKLTGRYRDGTAIYIPSQSIDVYDLRGNTPLGGNPKPRIFAHARIELFAPKGAALDPDDPSENRTINVVVPMYRQSENPKKAIKEIVALVSWHPTTTTVIWKRLGSNGWPLGFFLMF